MKKTIISMLIMVVLAVGLVSAISPIGSFFHSDSSERGNRVMTNDPTIPQLVSEGRVTNLEVINEGRALTLNANNIAEPREFWTNSDGTSRLGFITASCSAPSKSVIDDYPEGFAAQPSNTLLPPKNYIYGSECAAGDAIILKTCAANTGTYFSEIPDPDYKCYKLASESRFIINWYTSYDYGWYTSAGFNAEMNYLSTSEQEKSGLAPGECDYTERPLKTETSTTSGGSNDCYQLFGEPYRKNTANDNINLFIACNGYDCYNSNVMNTAFNGNDWFNNNIEDRYIAYDCVTCDTSEGSGYSEYTCDDPDKNDIGIKGTAVLRKDGVRVDDQVDYCSDTETVVESYCNDAQTTQGKIAQFSKSCPSGEVCSSGKCGSTSDGGSGQPSYTQFSYTKCHTDGNPSWFDTNGDWQWTIDRCSSTEECYKPSTGNAICRPKTDDGDGDDGEECDCSGETVTPECSIVCGYQAITCGKCEGNRFVKVSAEDIEANGRSASLEPLSNWDKILAYLGINSQSREGGVISAWNPDDVAVTCTGIVNEISGEPYYEWDEETSCKDGVPIYNDNYFKPKITRVWIKNSDGEWSDPIVMSGNPNQRISDEINNDENGWYEGAEIEVAVEVSNYKADVFDLSSLTDQQLLGLDTAVQDLREFTYAKSTGIGDIGGFFVKLGKDIWAWTYDDEDEEHRAKRINYIDAAPWMTRGVLEIGFYANDVVEDVGYGYSREAFGNELTDDALHYPNFFETNACQDGEQAGKFIKAFGVLMVSPIKNGDGPVEYWDMKDKFEPRPIEDYGYTDEDLNAELKILDKGFGGLNTIRIATTIKIPDKDTITLANGDSNFDPDGKYVLHAAIVNECWDSDRADYYQLLDNKALRFTLDPEAEEPEVCCAVKSVLGFLSKGAACVVKESECDDGLFGRWVLPDETCEEKNACTIDFDPDINYNEEDTDSCYECNSDGSVSELPVLYTPEDCNDLNIDGEKLKFHPVKSVIVKECSGGGPTITCVDCYGAELTKSGGQEAFCDSNKKEFNVGEDVGTRFENICSDELKNQVNCYQCIDKKGVINVDKYGNPERYILDGVNSVTACHRAGNYKDESYVLAGKCDREELEKEYPVVNPDNNDEWCWKTSGETVENACDDISYKRKDGILLSDLAILGDLPPYSSDPDSSFITSMREDPENPICYAAYGGFMCGENSDCIRASESNAPSRKNNRLIYDALYDLSPNWFGGKSIRNWFEDQVGIVDGSIEEDISSMGVCIYEEEKLTLKEQFAKLFGLDPNDPNLTWYMLGAAGIIVALFSMLMRPKN